MYLADNIRFLRKEKKFSQEFVAEQLGYKSYTTIQKWEMGVSEPPIKKLNELAKLFNADVHDMVNRSLTDNRQEELMNYTKDNVSDIPLEKPYYDFAKDLQEKGYTYEQMEKMLKLYEMFKDSHEKGLI